MLFRSTKAVGSPIQWVDSIDRVRSSLTPWSFLNSRYMEEAGVCSLQEASLDIDSLFNNDAASGYVFLEDKGLYNVIQRVFTSSVSHKTISAAAARFNTTPSQMITNYTNRLSNSDSWRSWLSHNVFCLPIWTPRYGNQALILFSTVSGIADRDALIAEVRGPAVQNLPLASRFKKRKNDTV